VTPGPRFGETITTFHNTRHQAADGPDLNSNVYTVSCPYCLVRQGMLCIKLTDGSPADAPHKARRERWRDHQARKLKTVSAESPS
jgi:hypothetical protein